LSRFEHIDKLLIYLESTVQFYVRFDAMIEPRGFHPDSSRSAADISDSSRNRCDAAHLVILLRNPDSLAGSRVNRYPSL
jgi:hypothetical protein